MNRTLGLSLPEDEGFNTIAGLCIFEHGRIPAAGVEIAAHGAILRIVEASPRRIQRVSVRVAEV